MLIFQSRNDVILIKQTSFAAIAHLNVLILLVKVLTQIIDLSQYTNYKRFQQPIPATD